MGGRMMTVVDEQNFREASYEFLAVRTNDGADSIHRDELLDFHFGGERIPLIDRQQGIRKPKLMATAISIMTTYTPPNQQAPYEDRIDPATGLLSYKWQGVDPNRYDNAGLRNAMELGLSVVWYFGVAPAVFVPVFPLFVIEEVPERHEFILSPQKPVNFSLVEVEAGEILRGYRRVEAKRRVHQPVFRGRVMQAYESRCAVCGLAHTALLDAAHIIPDREISGIAEVRNGLALCKIHHAAFDSGILGVTPDLRVEIRPDVLLEVDGPMLKHGLQERHGETLRVLPRNSRLYPDRDFLAERYARFLG